MAVSTDQFIDLTGYSAYYVTEGQSPGKLIRSLQRDPDRSALERVKAALTPDDKTDKISSLIRFLDTDGRLKTFWRLEMAAIRALFRRDTLAAAIMCVTALEVYVDNVLSEQLQITGVSTEEMKKILQVDNRTHTATVQDILDLARLDNKLKRGLRQTIHIDLGRRDIWQQWRSAYEMRNDAAHAGIAPPVEDTAEALITVRQMMETIEIAALNS